MKKKQVKIAASIAAGIVLAAIFGSVARDIGIQRRLERNGGTGRPMTAGEIEMVSGVYGSDLDYGVVRLLNTPYYGDDARAIGNNVYLETDALHAADLSAAGVGDNEKKILIHELYHVLKKQTGSSGNFWPALWLQLDHIVNNLFGTRLGYDFNVNSKTPFAGLNEEQQASMIEEYFRATQVFDRAGCATPELANTPVCRDVRADVAKYEEKLKPALPLPAARTLTLTPGPR